MVLLLIAPCFTASMALYADEPVVSFKEKPGQVEIVIGDEPLATYYYQDEKITRPHFAHLRAPGGVQGHAITHPSMEKTKPIMQYCTQVYGSLSVTSARRTAGEIKLKSDTRVLSISRPVALELDHLPFETSTWQTMALKSFARKRVAIPS